LVSLSTGIDKIDVSLDELNFCLEWDEDSPLWDIGLVRDMNRSLRRKPIIKPMTSNASSRSSGGGGSGSGSGNRGGGSSNANKASPSRNWPKSRQTVVN
jgi:hypothetical protein